MSKIIQIINTKEKNKKNPIVQKLKTLTIFVILAVTNIPASTHPTLCPNHVMEKTKFLWDIT
jgi:hypothetical protein